MKIQFTDRHPQPTCMLEEVCQGLGQQQKCLSPKFFYDEVGSQLFEAITRLPEYYLTRAEVDILQRHAQEIAAKIGTQSTLVEIGSGSNRKIRLLLNVLAPKRYLPIDISRSHLLASTQELAQDYPTTPMHAICADYTTPLELPTDTAGDHRVAFFPGSSISNYEPSEAKRLLRQITTWLGMDGALLIGVDLKKSPQVLHAAYNDAAGITARFNKNILTHLRRGLGAKLDPSLFRHLAFYNSEAGRIEMHLVSECRQQLKLNGSTFELDRDETIHTENCYKYEIGEFQNLASDSGYTPDTVWTDSQQRFSLHLLRVASVPNPRATDRH